MDFLMNVYQRLTRYALALGFTLSCVLAASAPHAQTSGSLYAELGGEKVLTKIVADAIKLWEENPVLAAQFKDANTDRLEKLLVQQFCALAGGGCKYEGNDMKSVHEKMGVTTAQFNALAEDLQTALSRNGIPSSTQNRLIALLAPMKRDVVTK
jgi:hemoglobin